jgi:hypothetical protein
VLASAVEARVTDRLKGFVVVLDQDLREDDAEATLTAIRQLRHVIAVEPVKAGTDDAFAEERVRYELGRRLLEVVFPERTKRVTGS